MARAGFYAIESRKIRFGRDGHWYSDDERIENPRIALLFSRRVKRRADGGYELEMGEERAPIEVEDTPYVVRRIEGDPATGLSIVLNDESSEALDLETLETGSDNALYCRVKGGAHPARFLRSAYYHLAPWIRPCPSEAGFVLAAGDREFPIRERP